MILFIKDLLNRHLNQRLRYGDRKAVYGLQVAYSKRGPAGTGKFRRPVRSRENYPPTISRSSARAAAASRRSSVATAAPVRAASST